MPRIEIPEIRAPKPKDVTAIQNHVEFRLSEETKEVLHQRRLSTRALEFVVLVAGIQPNFNNIEEMTHRTSISDVRFVFKGLNRPRQDTENGDDIYIYVIEPKQLYKYEPNMKCPAVLKDAPKGCCLAIFVKFDYVSASEPIGHILDWRWTECGSDGKPVGWQTRYMEEIGTDV